VSTLIAALHDWVEERGLRGRTRPWLVFKPPIGTFAKRAAVLEIEEPAVMGQVTLWESGECEVDLGSTTDPARTFIKSAHPISTEALIDLLEEAMSFCQELLTE